jgi:hypothetical protein
MKMNKPIRHLALILITALASVTFTGCASKPKPKSAAPGQTPVAPAKATARISHVSPEYHFVVVDFSSRPMPALGTQLNVYRAGKRIGSVRLTEPARAQFATADILNGELHVGDEVR